MATPIRIRIGASKDSSVDQVFGAIRRQAKKAADDINKDNVRAFRNISKAAHSAQLAQVGSAKEASAQILAELRRLEAAYRQFHDRTAASARKSGREQQKAMRGPGGGGGFRTSREFDAFARRTSHRATRFFWPNAPIASFAARAGRDFLRGAGIDTRLDSHVANIVEQQRLATNLSTQGYLKGAAGAAGKRVDPGVLQREARQIASELGVNTTDVLLGGKAFVGQRGNLAGFRGLARDIAVRSVSQGADYADLSLTAAKIDSALASQKGFRDEDKGGEAARKTAILDQLDVLIRQGKVGSVEFDNQAKQLPKLSGIAASFTGDVAKNLTQLMTVMQLAERGPAKNSATAATFAQNFALDLSKRSKEFRGAGVELFSGDGKLRSIRQIVIETLAATSGNRGGKNQVEQIQALLPNKRSFLALQEFLNVFQGAGGGNAGIKAVQAEFEKFGGTNRGQLMDDLDAAQRQTGNKVARFNAKIEEVVDKMAGNILPKMETLGPAALKLAETLGNVATWTVENPKSAIGAAIGLAIARAGIESTARAGMERAFHALGATKLAGLTLTATAVTLFATSLFEDKNKANKQKEGEVRSETESLVSKHEAIRQQIQERIASGDTKGADRLRKQAELDLSQQLGEAKQDQGITQERAATLQARDAYTKDMNPVLKAIAETNWAAQDAILARLPEILGGDPDQRSSGGIADAQKEQIDVLKQLKSALDNTITALGQHQGAIENLPKGGEQPPTGSNL